MFEKKYSGQIHDFSPRSPLPRHVSCIWYRWHINSGKERFFWTHLTLLTHLTPSTIGWLRLVESIKFLVSFAKEPYKTDDILQKRPIILSILLTVATPYRKWLQGWFSRNIFPQFVFQATTFEPRVLPMMLMARGWRRALTIDLQFSDSIDHIKWLYIELTFKNFCISSRSTDSFEFRELFSHEFVLQVISSESRVLHMMLLRLVGSSKL